MRGSRNEKPLDLQISEYLHKYIVSYDDFVFTEKVSGDEYAEIWVAQRISTDRPCIVKRRECDTLSSEFAKNYMTEVKHLAQIDNPFVLPFVGFTRRPPYCIITEYIPNSSLYTTLRNDNLTPTQLTAIALGIACGMAGLHEIGLVNPTLSTHNIALTESNTPKLCLFNTAPRTAKWEAPELFDENEYDFKCDVFNYAMILYEMVTKKEPFSSWSKEAVTRILLIDRKRPAIPQDVPDELRYLVKRCWQHSAENRPNFSEIYDEIESGMVFFAGTDHARVQRLVAKIRNVMAKKASRSNSLMMTSNAPARSDDACAREGMDLSVFEHPETTEFFEALDVAHLELRDDQMPAFFRTICKVFSREVSDVLMAVTAAMAKLMTRHAAMKALAEQNIIRFLPYDNLQILDSALNILHPLFESMPKIFEVDFAPVISQILKKRLEKGLILIQLFARAFNELENPWSILDLLIDYERVFLKSDLGYEYVSTLYFLCFNFSKYKQARINQCRGIFCSFLSSNHKSAVSMAYKAICDLWDDLYEIPIDRVSADLCDRDLAFSALSVLIRMKEVPISKEIIYPVLSMAETRVEATLLLLTMVKSSSEAGSIMLSKPEWMTKEFRRREDTLRLFLAIMEYKNLRLYASSLKELPAFLNMIVNSNNRVCMVCLSSICKRLGITQELVFELSRLQFFQTLFSTADRMKDSIITQLSCEILANFAKVGYTKDYLLVVDRIKEYLNCDQKASRSAFVALCTLSKYAECARLFKQMGLDMDVRNLITDDNEQSRVLQFLNNLQAYTQRRTLRSPM